MALEFKVGMEVVTASLEAIRPYLNTLLAGLHLNNPLPAAWQSLAAYTQPTFSGYALQETSWLGPVQGDPTNAFLIATPPAWSSSSSDPQQFAEGWFLFDPIAGLVVFAVRPDNAPQPVVTVGPFTIDAKFVEQFSAA